MKPRVRNLTRNNGFRDRGGTRKISAFHKLFNFSNEYWQIWLAKTHIWGGDTVVLDVRLNMLRKLMLDCVNEFFIIR